MTYLDIINEVLRDVNEVPLKVDNFSTARGVQDFAKKAVNRAYMDIVISSQEWPWLLDTTGVNGNITVPTVDGQQNYTVASPHNLDLDTVSLVDPDDMSRVRLPFISYDEWNLKYRNQEEDVDNKGKPCFIFKHPGSSLYGLTPAPDKEYTLEFTRWNPATPFVNDTDTLPFPDQYYTVLLNRALFYVWMWRENLDHANQNNTNYERGLKQMQRHLLTNKLERMRAI